MHYIDSHVGANKEPNDEEYDEEPPELVEGSDDEDDLDSEDEQASDDEDAESLPTLDMRITVCDSNIHRIM